MYILKHRNGWIMGAKWDKGATPTLTRTYGATGMVANIGIDAQIVRNDFDGAPLFREMIDVEDTLGNKFIRVPKLYIKKIDEVIKQKVLVKGFTIQDCINRRGNRILNEITSKEKNVVLEIENLTLISQHGLGVND